MAAETEESSAPSGITNGNSHEQNGNSEKADPEHKHGVEAAKEKLTRKQQKIKDKKNPAGGYDRTPIPPADDGYTVRFTFHRAENLPISDFNTMSSDPYIHATLTSSLRKRHKEDPDMVLRTRTIHKKTDPVWDYQWTVAGVPSTGFRLKCRLYDEDPSDHDDRLGNVTIHVTGIGKDWEGIKDRGYDIKKRMGSKRAYLMRGCVVFFNRNLHMSGKLHVSMEVLGESEKPYGRMYTVGEMYWTKHFSPMIGRIVGTKAPGGSNGTEQKAQRYDFQANEIQLSGPVPSELYHRFVEFKPFVKGMFSKAGPRGRILNKALRHQHTQVYNFNNKTEWGTLEPGSPAVSLQFLKMVHFDEGGRMFTYVLTLDGLLRFTETGKEFGIDMLSKHTMHSNVAVYIACSGEFFIRRLKNPDRHTHDPEQETHPDSDLPGGPPNAPPPEDPKYYELVIDNDSGTYRPDASVLSLLKKFLKKNLPGLHIVVKACDDERLIQMKNQQRERKKKEGQQLELIQDSDGEVSSSDEEQLRKGRGRKRARAYEALEDPKGMLEKLRGGPAGTKEDGEGTDSEVKVNGEKGKANHHAKDDGPSGTKHLGNGKQREVSSEPKKHGEVVAEGKENSKPTAV